MVDETLRARVSKLSHSERLDLISELWQSIESESLAVSPADQAMLDARLHDLEVNPDAGRPWQDVVARLR